MCHHGNTDDAYRAFLTLDGAGRITLGHALQ